MQINLTGPVNNTLVNPLLQAVASAVQRGDTEIRIGISSPGGNVYYGVTAHNFLAGIPIPVLTHNMGQVDSVTAVLYCAGSQRSCAPNARFLIHSIGITLPGQATFEEKQMQERVDGMKNDRANIARILAGSTGRSQKDVEDDMLNGRILNAEEAKAYGFVHTIASAFFDLTSEVVHIQSVGT